MGRTVPATGRGVGSDHLVVELGAAAGAFIAAAPALITALVALTRAEQARAAPTHTHQLTDTRRPVSDGTVTQPFDLLTAFLHDGELITAFSLARLDQTGLDQLHELGRGLVVMVEEEWARRDTPPE